MVMAKKVICPFCEQVCKNGSRFIEHCNSYHSNLILGKWHPCDECSKLLPSVSSLNKHKGRMHQCRPRKVCQFCPMEFSRSSEYYKHANECHAVQLAQHWTPCYDCDMAFPSVIALRRHNGHFHQQTRPKVGGGRKVACRFCPATFQSIKAYYKHGNKSHRLEIAKKWLICDACDMALPTEMSLEMHKKTLHPDTALLLPCQRVQCDFCPADFYAKAHFYEHANEMHKFEIEGKWLVCNVCSQALPSAAAVKAHKQQEHGLPAYESKIMQCQFCPANFNSNDKHNQHANKVHKAEVMSKWQTCEVCGLSFPTLNGIQKHKQRMHKMVPNLAKRTHCDFCSSNFINNDKYLQHANKNHREEISLTWQACNCCQLFFPTIYGLEKHKQRMHKSAAAASGAGKSCRSIQCQVCQAFLHSSDTFLQHANKMHRAEIQFSWHGCDLCSVFFPTAAGLQKHRVQKHKIDDTVKKYQCPFCTQGFQSKEKMRLHANKDHVSDIQDKWLACDVCHFFLPNLIALKIHKGLKHQTEEGKAKCEFCDISFSRKQDTYKHANKIHPAQVKFHWLTCEDCNYSLPTLSAMNMHKQRIH